ncbi:hypothetical protein PV417_09695 [Streptomyces sp. ME19-03-3]|nr:hypothetical protein [Streptomyces sp. ME19-03-3]
MSGTSYRPGSTVPAFRPILAYVVRRLRYLAGGFRREGTVW